MSETHPCLAIAFAEAMDRLGPLEPRPALAVAVSGGADSMALALLARNWVHERDGTVLALVVDHGLRAASGDEARLTVERLAHLGVPARLLPLTTLTHGPALAERARIMRYQVLSEACREAGILHLLLGHHAADQVETLAMRVLRDSQTHGLAGMAAVVETRNLRLLRPLLDIEPTLFRAFLTARGIDWVEDPSNRDLRALRPRLRHSFGAHIPNESGLPRAMSAVGQVRAREETEAAIELANRATIRPEGFAVLSPGRIGAAALSNLVRTIGGAAYPPSPAQINDLAARPRPATLAGVRILPAGRFADGLLVVREEAAIAEPAEAADNVIWDSRFRLIAHQGFPEGGTIGKLGSDAARFRGCSDLPSAVLRTLPAVRFGKILAEVPHLGYATNQNGVGTAMLFSPPRPIGGPCFVPASQHTRW
ncbi:MAG: tRNA lysidine(34) synthetase TilS [Rhodopila sp.]|nr:tRNA lysidine(34) synthetase TilS [Rhodopila sp.]